MLGIVPQTPRRRKRPREGHGLPYKPWKTTRRTGRCEA